MDNLVTSGAHKEVDGRPGALTMGIYNTGADTALVDNIVAHLADPDNPAEQAEREWTHRAVDNVREAYYDDTIVYNWLGSIQADRGQDPSPNQNVAGLDPALLDDTTIQNFAAALLGDPNATISDLADYIRATEAGTIQDEVTADDIYAYFDTAFGGEAEREGNATLRFTPDDRGDGVRWDNRLNWSTEDKPIDGDDVDLGGNWVNFGGSVRVNDLSMGGGADLTVGQGRLVVSGELDAGSGAEIDVEEAGQIWVEDYHTQTGKLDVDVDGGRFANTGFFDGLLDMHITDGQALLGVDDAVMELGNGSVVTIDGDDAKVGFDGDEGGVSVLRMETGSELRMIADGSGFTTIEEFRSGAHVNDTPDVLSAFDMGEGTLLVDVGAISGGGARSEVLVDTDQIVGMFDDVEFIGLNANQDATLTVDYETDKITVSLGTAGQGTGKINVATVGNMLNAADDAEIWTALTEGQGTYEEVDPTPTVNGDELDENDILAA
jgi:hypothetical protein